MQELSNDFNHQQPRKTKNSVRHNVGVLMLSSVGQLFESDSCLDYDLYGSDYYLSVSSWIKRDVLR